MSRRQTLRQSAGSSLCRPVEKIANPYALVKPFDIVLHKLSPEFIDDALSGKIDWSFPRRSSIVDWESFFREKMARISGTVDESTDDQRSPKKKKSKKRRKDPVVLTSDDETYNPEDDDHESTNNIVEDESIIQKRPRTRPKQLKCQVCSFTTTETELLAVHAKVHQNICNDCNLTFGSVYKYQKHVYEIHKPPVELKYNVVFGCKICNEYFDDEGCANLHISGHIEASEDGKFACMLCNVTFARENGVTKHLVTKHMYYKCTFCDLLASTFDSLERHSQSAHSAFGKPYACDLCDFRSAVFGTLSTHRKISHGLEKEGDHERCRFCAYLLINDREVILEHLAGHIDVILFECRHCENIKTSSFAMIREHGINFHATDVIQSYAKVHELNEMALKVKAMINRRTSKGKSSSKKGERPKPTNTETKDAIAGIYVPEEKISLDSILDTSMKHSDDMYNPPTFQMPVATSPTTDQPDSSCDPSFSYYPTNENLIEPQQCTYVGSHDPLSIAMQSVNPNGTSSSVQVVPQTSEGVLSVDPVTGQLFLQGLPVMDEKGNPILVALQGTCLGQPQVPTQPNPESLDNGGTSTYQPGGNGLIDSNSLLDDDPQYQGNIQDPFMGGNTLENG
ncbi:uncharacterized protein LOC141852795 [Brevipalpus obovatus]|uniref:uncharacterized protein LOC141852795 n=1 Tax=Brevipalpus obovatus TaxID=246614 RepID=UPI003D9E682F